jgi:cellulose synthase/poly-beta-1,6-N-acetylglucosamine synthase-like glycosyltransferase
MIWAYYFFAAVLVWLSLKSFRGGLRYLEYFRQKLAEPEAGREPFVTVIAPCRGNETGLDANLLALVRQDYADYEVIFVVDDAGDEAVPVIGEVSREAAKDAKKTKMIIAPKAAGCSQKVENLREAVLHAAPGSEAFVFVDSDVRPSPGWLKSLVSPLSDKTVGAATGYRWLISPDPSFASEMRSAWNASIASSLGPNRRSNFCWGGSMAIRRDVFERVGMRDKWAGTLSDDFAVTRAMNAASLPIVFVPQALTASVESCTFAQMLEFTTRQMKITRVYAPKLWLMSLVGSAMFIGVLIASLSIVVFNRDNNAAFTAAIATIVLVTAFSAGKAWLRLKAVKLVLTPYRNALDRQALSQCTLCLLTPAVFLYNSVAAALSRQMTWRGTSYVLKSPTETVIIAQSAGRQK